jgi:hypothetical protein
MRSVLQAFREGASGVPRDLETIRRSFLRKLLGLDTGSSAPFISGDSFKYLSDIVFEGNTFNFPAELSLLSEGTPVVFAQGWPVSPAARELADYCNKGKRFPNATLIIHNCDQIPTPDQMKVLANSFKRVFSVNWLGDPEIVSPLPIGLENRDKRRNGVPRDYEKAIRKGLPSFEQRDIEFLVCFSMHTNLMERESAFNAAVEIPGSHIVTESITPKQYRNLLLRSKYVISPPGNGPDCHRTWEAMYLGAIPVVKRQSWPFQHIDLPVIQIDEWNEIVTRSDWSFSETSVDWQKFDFWFKK